MEIQEYPIAFPRCLSVEQVARRCQATPEAVQLWIDLGMLEMAPDRNEPVVSLPALAAFLDHYSLPAPTCSERRLRTVLIVDDEPYVGEVIREVFEPDERLQLHTAESGLEGLIRLGQLKPDLLFLDVYMPGMDGIEVCRRVKGHPAFADTRVVVCTGFPLDSVLDQLSGIGVDRILIKPVPIPDLLDVVYGLLTLPRLHRGTGNPVPEGRTPSTFS